MTSTFHGIEIAKRSLFTQQAALQTTGQNIANANTEGYSRQVVNMVASRPMEAPGMMRSTTPGQLGTGVEFDSITRIREGFLDEQYRNENQNLGNWQIQSDTLDKLQTITNEPSDSGLRSVLDEFWKSWSDLSNDPLSVTGRKIVREDAIALTNALNLTSQQLTDLRNDLTNNVGVKAQQINTDITTIANLNGEIARIEGFGDNANDLRDQRDKLVDDLSKVVNVKVADTPQGYTITMGGITLVSGQTSAPVTTASLEDAFSSGDMSGGEAFGMLVSRDKYVKDYISELDTIASTLATGKIRVTIPKDSVLPDGTTLNVVQPDGTTAPQTFSGSVAARTASSDMTVEVDGLNGLHQLGYTFKSPVTAGGDFFTSKDGSPITAANIQLNPDIQNDSGRIASSMRTVMNGSTEEVVEGNNTLALLVSQLNQTNFDFSTSANPQIQTGTIDDYYRSMVGTLGVQANEATRQTDNLQSLVGQVDSRRQSVSGVSLDEEMSNMIKFQHAYSAAARVMTTFDEMLDKIINSMGTVGR